MRPTPRAVAVLLVALAGACAPAPGASVSPTRNSREITSEEVRAAQQHNAYELVQALRPHWLRKRSDTSTIPRAVSRGPVPDDFVTAYRDGQRLGPVETLRSISVNDVESLRHYDASSAQQRFGNNNTNGTVEVLTRRGGT